jgi:RNA polymerase sigma factor (TIGR02999 family)
LARHHLSRERPGHTLQSTALVHEVYLRLYAQHAPGWHNRAEFFATVGHIIRRVLIDHARGRHAQKRGDGAAGQPLEAAAEAPDRAAPCHPVLADGLDDLARKDSRKADIVALRYFVGLSVEEIAGALGISVRTVNREWTIARAWLHAYMADAA